MIVYHKDKAIDINEAKECENYPKHISFGFYESGGLDHKVHAFYKE
jgi:hypothetical protein